MYPMISLMSLALNYLKLSKTLKKHFQILLFKNINTRKIRKSDMSCIIDKTIKK